MKVECYVEQSTRRIGKATRGIGYVLECSINGKPVTVSGLEKAQATSHAAELTAVVSALKRMQKPADITIHTEDAYILTYARMIDELAAGGFLKSDGTVIKNRELWEEFYELTKPHSLTVRVGNHQYTNWIRSELKRRETEETA